MRGALRPQMAMKGRSGFAGFGGFGGLGGGDPCMENFWSAACWFGSKGSQALGIDPGAATIDVTAPPVSNCAGTLQTNGTCMAVPQPNDPNGTTDELTATGGNFQEDYAAWVERTRASASTPQNNTAGTGYLWMIGVAVAAIFIFSKGGR